MKAFYYKDITQDLQICIAYGTVEIGSANVFLRGADFNTIWDFGTFTNKKAEEIFLSINTLEDIRKYRGE